MTTTLLRGAPLAALTSVFTPPCPTSWLISGTRLPSQLPVFPRTGSAGCDPPAWQRNLDGGGFQYYSPAVCPQGFVVGPGCGLTMARLDEGFPSVIPGENVAYCVPAGMSCTTDTTNFRGGVWGFTQAQVITAPGDAFTVGPAMQIRWRDSDLDVLETHPLTPGFRRQAVETGAAPATPGPTTAFAVPTTRPGVTIVSTPTSVTFSTTAASGTRPSGQADSNGDMSGSIDRKTAAFVITILTVLAAVMLGILALILFFRRRSRKFGGPGKFYGVPDTLIGWFMLKWEARRGRSRKDEKGKIVEEDDIAGAELGFHGQSILPELEFGPARGSTNNPAELDGWGVGKRPQRWSGIPTRPRHPPEVPPDEELPYAVHRLSSVTERTEASHERVEEQPPPVPPKPAVPPSPISLQRPQFVHIRPVSSRSLTVSHPKRAPMVPTNPARPASINLVSPLSPPGSPVFGNQTIVYSNWRHPQDGTSPKEIPKAKECILTKTIDVVQRSKVACVA
ncbi:hypothetical protein B0T14DRAFT_234033 [Immersiella caudata]|uniref:Uncharacterized protein n=1 Tax=Immersiella caudata TaxID=314043 RepID=A0AA39WSA6_9PEZI|nr:hypothetical protein B0T14DRAFT_234033 [Immersiella caudata]